MLGPEVALSPQFDDEVLKDSNFREKLCLVAIDELHVVDQWGNDFRPAYSRLAILRKRLPRDVPWFGTSATLDPDMLKQVKELMDFNSDVKVMRTSVDRPEIGFEIRPMEHAATSFSDLKFLIEPAKECSPSAANVLRNGLVDALDKTPSNKRRTTAAIEAIRNGDLEAAREFLQGGDIASQALKNATKIKELEAKQRLNQMNDQTKSKIRCNRIPKTIVYIERIAEIEIAEQRLIGWLIQAGCSRVASTQAVTAYHSELAEFDKHAISTEFKKADCDSLEECSQHRIILATDAMGMGINNPDIACIVQYRQPKDMCSVMQRAGRAARALGAIGMFIWLVDSWCFGPTAEQFKLLHKPAQGTSLAQSSQQGANNTCGSDGLDSEQLVSARQSKGVKAASEAQRRSNLPKGFWKLFNKDPCIRRGILEYFSEDLTNFHKPECYCCSKCAGITIKPMLIHAVTNVQSGAKISTAVHKALLEWRVGRASSKLEGLMFTDPSILLPDPVARLISRAAGTVVDLPSLKDITKKQWACLDLFGSEVLDVIQRTKAKVELQALTKQVGSQTLASPQTLTKQVKALALI